MMWVRGTGTGNTPQLLGVASADSPEGPFTFAGNQTDPFHTVYPGNRNLPVGYQYADATLFQDPKTSECLGLLPRCYPHCCRSDFRVRSC